jgi:hypothetical protein
MPVHFDIRPMVHKHSKLPMARLRIVSRFEDAGLTTISRGIVFVFAAWSGYAVLALQRFTRIMAELPTNSLELVVLDIDRLTADTAAQLFGTSGFHTGGNGETICVRDGAVVAREQASSASEHLLFGHTRELLNDRAAEQVSPGQSPA